MVQRVVLSRPGEVDWANHPSRGTARLWLGPVVVRLGWAWFLFVVGLEQDTGVTARTIDHGEAGPAVAATVGQDVSGAVFMVAAGAFPLTDYGDGFTAGGATKKFDHGYGDYLGNQLSGEEAKD